MSLKRIQHWIATLAILLFLGICVVLSLLNPRFRSVFIAAEIMPETRGLAVAQAQGCFHCHATFGSGGVPNPGHSDIPAWQGFSFMMSMTSEDELREWILDGVPARIADDPSYLDRKANMTVPMPAYRGKITKAELNDLVAFYHAVSGTIWPADPEAERGLEIAREKGCFTCHGFAGRFDMPNPGALNGTIPAWHGKNFDHLVRDEEELRTWILDGEIPRLRDNFWARWFLTRQVIKMPAYRDVLTKDELNAIITYIQWLRDPEAPGTKPSFTY